MENKPKTSSYKRLKPYIKGFPIPFVLAIVGAIISAVITVIGPDKQRLPILLLKVLHLPKWGRFQVLIWIR